MSKSHWGAIPVFLAILVLLQSQCLLLDAVGADGAELSSPKTAHTWNGIIELDSDYTVSMSDVLTIESCTQINMDAGVRLNIDGRIVIEGTPTCPVIMDNQGGGDHWGLSINSSSAGKANSVEHLTIRNSDYGISIFGADGDFSDIIIENPDKVGIDIYNGATPHFDGVSILGGGWDEHGGATTWRYGIGISVGNYSAPIFEDVAINGTLTRGINFWGNSGGLYSDITISNVTGSTLAAAAGVWVMDAIPYIENVTTTRCDTGIWVRQYDDGVRTGAVIRDAVVRDSRFHGVLIDKYDRTNYSNYVEATIEGLEVSGTGGPNASAQGDGIAAIEVNVSGAILEDVLVDDNPVPGLVSYLSDSTLYVRNATFIDSGKPLSGSHSASIYVSSAFFAPVFEQLDISGAPGPGILIERGSAAGEGWELHDNNAQGLVIEHATVHANWINSTQNGLSGAYIHDSSNVILNNLTTTSNGDLAGSSLHGSGITFHLSNDVETSGKDVTCINCTSIDDALGGIHVQDSIDLYLSNAIVREPRGDGYGLFVDNAALSHPGMINIDSMLLELNRSGAIAEISAAANIDGLDIRGNTGDGIGLVWDGSSASLTSSISNSVIDSQECASFSNLIAGGEHLICSGSLTISSSLLNFSAFTATNSASVPIFIQDSNTHLHLHQPANIDFTIAYFEPGSKVEEAYDLDVWVLNQFHNGLPFAQIDVDYLRYNTDHSVVTDSIGHAVMPDYVVREWISGIAGTTPSHDEEVDLSCTYDGTTNSTGAHVFSTDLTMYCSLTLTNQPPFIVWTAPEEDAIFPSEAEVIFDANESWDLDNDPLTYTWFSSIDGDLHSSCTQSVAGDDNKSFLIVNNIQMANEGCLSDGVHEITLEVCDDEQSCANETRTITLANQPAVVNITVSPYISGDGVLRIPRSTVVDINVSGTYDPEGEPLSILLTDSYHSQIGQPPDVNMAWSLSFVDAPEDTVTVTITFDDGVVGNLVTWTLDIILFNELPMANFEVHRTDDLSQTEITLNGSASVDPEGDEIQVEWSSSIDGILFSGNGTAGLVWFGYLSAGTHELSLRLTDGLHDDQWDEASTIITVQNSPPVAVIHSPSNGDINLSSDELNFSAYSSGDWDSSCDAVEGVMWYCNPHLPIERSDLLLLMWTSNLDGELESNENDGWFWNGYLSAGDHIITLYVSDGHSDPVQTSVEVHIDSSAPKLILDSPSDEMTHRSNQSIKFDLRRSVDYDGDSFTWSLFDGTSVLINQANPSAVEFIQFPKGMHLLTLILEDSTGMTTTETIELDVLPSNPLASITSPTGHYEASTSTFSFEAGTGVHLNAEESYDADGDIATYEWAVQDADDDTEVATGAWTVITGDVASEIQYFDNPGRYFFRLQIVDELGLIGEKVVIVVIESSRPELSDLQAHPDNFDVDVQSELRITVVLSDPDSTTSDVRASIVLGEQEWEVILNDNGSEGDAAAGDNVWTGVLTWIPGSDGFAALKVTATDSDDRVDTISLDPPIKIGVGEFSLVEMLGGGPTFAIGGLSLAMLISVLAGILIRRRRAKIEHIEDFIEDWGALTSTSKKEIDDELDI